MILPVSVQAHHSFVDGLHIGLSLIHIFYAPAAKNKSGAYKMKSGQVVYLCFSTDFLIEEADAWREECWQMIRNRSDLHFIFLTKRIERFRDCIPDDWKDGYENVTVGCTVENQDRADYRLSIFRELPIKHKNIICQDVYKRQGKQWSYGLYFSSCLITS